MLTKIALSDLKMPRIKKMVNGVDLSDKSAFEYGVIVDITVEAPRRLGASAVVLRINADGEPYNDIPLAYVGTSATTDTYCISIDTKDLCKDANEGLFFYELLFVRGTDTLFTDTVNYVDYFLSDHSERKFIFLIYEKGFKTPSWFKGGIMYHIFVDRFYRGSGNVAQRKDVIINDDWCNGIPQYPENRGDELSNNVFFGGNLWGIAEKLDRLVELGVNVIYLSPIFEAYSNHKYDTGNYLKIDGMFGGEDAFRYLIEKAKEKGIRIILDGVFNHTGDDSLYFDRYGKYGRKGAYSDPQSPYRTWFNFKSYPTEYETWWGIKILPKLRLTEPTCLEFFTGEGGVIEKYTKLGIGGWRLDVADELTNDFLDLLRERAKNNSSDEAVIIGEVWENAAEKVSYDKRRRYFRGRQLDSVMNYPFRNGVLSFLIDKDAEFFGNVLTSVYSSYPECVCHSLMNILGTHDTERILTVLGEECPYGSDEENAVLAKKRLSADKLNKAIDLLKIASTIQYTVYGVPSVYYGDEVGLEGYHDPFCRMPYPWEKENQTLLDHYKKLAEIRHKHSVFIDGTFKLLKANDGIVVYSRVNQDETLFILANVNETSKSIDIDISGIDLLKNNRFTGNIDPYSAVIIKTEV